MRGGYKRNESCHVTPATRCNTMKYTAIYILFVQRVCGDYRANKSARLTHVTWHTATHCNTTLQHTAICCNIRRYRYFASSACAATIEGIRVLAVSSFRFSIAHWSAWLHFSAPPLRQALEVVLQRPACLWERSKNNKLFRCPVLLRFGS